MPIFLKRNSPLDKENSKTSGAHSSGISLFLPHPRFAQIHFPPAFSSRLSHLTLFIHENENDSSTSSFRMVGKSTTSSSISYWKLLLLVCSALIAIALVADFFWASSTIDFPSVASKHRPVLLPSHDISFNVEQKLDGAGKKNGRNVSATYADLAAPEWQWEEMPPAPVPRLDGYAVQIKNRLYVFSGYGTIEYVHSHIDIYDFEEKRWAGRIEAPKEMANSHLGVATDGRYVYVVSGQHGAQCRKPISLSFVLDTHTQTWHQIPSLPAPRYAPATQLWRGRLHVMGGSKEDRYTTAVDHWSIAVKDGEPLETRWRSETPIPRGGPHRACVVVNDRLYVIGGQEGDFMPKPGSPIFKCSRRHEVMYGDVYMLDGTFKWHALPPMPKPNSHIECAWVVLNNSIIILGGTTQKHPLTKKMILVAEVFQFHLDSLTWSVIGKLPFRVKTTLAGFWDGWLYFTSGQRDRGPHDPSPKKVIGEMWRTKLSL